MSVTVRPALSREYPEVGDLTVAAYRASGQLVCGSGYESDLQDVEARAEHGVVLVAVDEPSGRLLGTVTFLPPGSAFAELASAPDEAEFRMLAVDPAAQGRGVGRLLAAECLRRARWLGCASVVICYRDFVDAAWRLYRGLGFERLPDRDRDPHPGVHLLALRARLGQRTPGD